MNAIPLLFFLKAHVKAHDRRLPSGRVVRVKAHEDGRTKKHRLTHPGRLFDWFSRLGNQAGTPEQGIRDAHSLLNLPGIIAFRRSDELGYETPAAVDTKSGELLVNPDFKLTRAQWAQVMAEEIMHVVDLVSPGRSLSVASKRLDQHDGDIAREAILAHAGDKGLADFLAYPLSASGLSWQTKRAELFARLAVLYHGDPSQMQRQLPIAYEAYHVLFGTTLLGPDSRVLRDVRSKRTAGGAARRGRKRIGANPNGGFGYRDSGDAAHQGLVALRGAIAQVFDANPAGRSILASLLNAAPNIIQEPLTDAQFRRQLDLFLDLDATVPEQAGPKTEAAKRAAADAVESLRGSKRGVLAPRLADTYAARQRVSLVGQKLRSREDLATLAQVYRDPRFETFRLFFVDSEGKIVTQVGLSSRLPASSAVFVGPDNQEYLDGLARSARMAGATGYYMLHNHPSTNPMPSDADIRTTKYFAQNINMVNYGHVVLDTNKYGVIRPEGFIKIIDKDFGQVSPFAAHELSNVAITSPEALVEVAKKIHADKDAVTLVVTNNQHTVLGVTSIPAAELLKTKRSTRMLRIRRILKRMNGAGLFAVGSNRRALGPLSDLVMDAIHITESGAYQSVRQEGMGAYGGGDPFAVKERQIPRVSPDTSPEFDYLRDKTLAERKRWKRLTQTVGVREEDGIVRKSITLVLPSGNEYRLNQGQYRWQVSNLLLKALGPGERWITVHPNGNKDAKGVPVLVRESQTGSGVYHVIGGAGGKLNYLKLRGLKPQSDYKAQARERAANKRQAKQEQAKQERESGTAGVKNAQREAVNQQQRQQEAQFVEQVAKAMGWEDQAIRFDPEAHKGLSPVAMKKAADRHHREVLQRATEAVEVQRERLVADPDLRAAAGLDHMPAHSDIAHELAVDDLDPVTPPGNTLGFAPKYEQRAEQAGATPEAIKQEAAEVKDARLTPEQREAAIKRGETREAVKKELENIRPPVRPDLKTELVDAQQAVELLKMKKQLHAVRKRAQAAREEIDKDQSGKVKAYNITVGGEDPDLDDKVKSDLENDIRAAQTRTFLSTVRETGGKDYEQTLNTAIGAGAFNSINALAITAGGAALVDRSVVDVLGPAGAAQVLARRLHADLDAETVDKLVGDFEDFHLHHYMDTSKASMEQAAKLQEQAKALQIDEASDATDLALAKSITEKRMKAIAESQRLLGTALGEMETNAALVAALKAGRTDTSLEVPLGAVSPEDAIKQARAIGLQRGDYRLDKVDGNEILTVSPEGLDRLAKPVDVADLKRARRNLDIIEGREDEENWLPKGVANRPDLAMPPVNPGVADVLAKPFEPGDDLEQSLKDYIGGRMADGDAPADILSDVQSQTFFDKAGADRFSDYMAALDKVAPLKDAKGKARPVESLRPDFENLADEFVDRHYGGSRSPLHRQTFDPNDEAAAESLYRSLAEVPEGIAAYKPIGELTPQDQRALREFFHANVAREDENAAELRHELEDLSRQEPDKEFEDMFGEVAENPEWREWKNQRDNLAEQVNRAKLSWDKYTTVLRGQAPAYAAIQDMIKSRITEKFLDHYNRANSGQPLKVGRSVIRNNLAHADAIDPALRESRLEEQRQFNARLQARNAGKFASDDVIGKQQAAREAEEAMKQAQFSLFGDEEAPEVKATPLRADERHTLGHAAENQISRMVPMMARNFKPGQPFQMWQPSMNGKGVARQRAVKLVEANKRFALGLGTGSGKTLIQLGSFTHLQQTGQAKRGLFLVPSIVQSEFRGEAARYLDPKANNGQGFSYHIEPGASREERIAAYKDPKHHFAVMTHSAFRDDMLHLGAQQAGIDTAAMRDKLAGMKPEERKAWIQGVMEKEGINFDFVSVDEFQGALNRLGKEDSSYANVLGALSQTSPYFVAASADLVKNDLSEVQSLLSYIDPERYGDRAEFMRRYGGNTEASKTALKQELNRYVYAHKIDPEGVKALKQTVSVDLNDDQHAAMTDLKKHLAAARLARMAGKVDVGAVKALMPERFADIPEDQHEAAAKELQRNLGLLKESAMGRIIDDQSVSAKYGRAVELANARKGKPGIIFAHRIQSVNELAKKLEAEGHPVTVLTGKDSPDEKAKKVREYKAKGGILVASDAASTGMNAQNAQWVVQYDTPQTAMTHAQRGARAYRTGQQNDVELIDLVANHEHERKARDRLSRKYELRDLMTSPLESMDDGGLAYFLKQRDSQQVGSLQ